MRPSNYLLGMGIGCVLVLAIVGVFYGLYAVVLKAALSSLGIEVGL